MKTIGNRIWNSYGIQTELIGNAYALIRNECGVNGMKPKNAHFHQTHIDGCFEKSVCIYIYVYIYIYIYIYWFSLEHGDFEFWFRNGCGARVMICENIDVIDILQWNPNYVCRLYIKCINVLHICIELY